MRKHIYVCTPSAPFDAQRFQLDHAIKNLDRLGFDVTVAKHALDDVGNTSASIQDRLDDLYEGFTNPSYDLVMATRGGWNSNELLPHLDFEMLKKHAKPFCGMSDMTTLCINLYQRAGVPTIYGHLLLHFALSDDLSKFQSFIDTVNNLRNPATLFPKGLTDANIVKPGSFSGRLLGGNLAVLCWLLGTPFALRVKPGTVLFIEDDEETNGYYWQMYLEHLKQTGIFDKLSGMIVGKVLPETEFTPGTTIRSILQDVTKDFSFPIVMEAEFGHIDFPTPIVYGNQVTIRAET